MASDSASQLYPFLVPKPRLGNALAGEAPRLPVTGDGPKPGLGNEEKTAVTVCNGYDLSLQS